MSNAVLRRGSEWRRWDLHIHSPASALANEFPHDPDGKPDWEAYISALEKIQGVAAFGVTDYFSVDGYREVRKFKEQGRVPNVELILPNVELRLDNLVYRTREQTEPPRRLNVHVIFSNDISPEVIEEHFLSRLKFNYVGNPQGRNEVWNVTRTQLEELGRRIKREQTTFTGSDFEVGCTLVTVDINDVKDALENRPSIFKNKYILALAEEHLSFIKWEGQDHQIRKVLLQGADAIFSGNPDTRFWALGQKDLTIDQFRSEFRSLKSCIHGSDAHRISKIAIPDDNRFCWIKGNPTFEGLRQILFEPDDRVYIGERPPVLKHDYQVIESVQVIGSPDWFNDEPIPLNANLVAVIGGRGTGKSALAELVAYAGGSGVFRKPAKENKDTFLYKASLRSPRNLTPVTSATVQLNWLSAGPDSSRISEDLQTSLRKEKVNYLPQKFVEHLCAPENTENIEREIERVIFQRIVKTDRMGASSFSELRKLSTKAIAVKKEDLRLEIEALNQSIYEGFRKMNQKHFKKAQIDKLETELAELLKGAPTLPAENKNDVEQLGILENTKTDLEGIVERLNEQLSTIEELRALFASFAKQISAFNERAGALLTSVGLHDSRLAMQSPHEQTVTELLDERKDAISSEIRSHSEGAGDASIDGIQTKIALLREGLNISAARKTEYEKFQSDKKALEAAISSLQREINEVDAIVSPKVEQQRAARLERYLDFFAVLTEERAALEHLYVPLGDALSKGGETDKKLTFVSKVVFDAAKHAVAGMSYMDTRKRKAAYRDEDDLEISIKKMMARIDNSGYQRTEIKREILEFRNSFLRDAEGNPLTFGEQLKKDKTEEDFNNWFYDISDFSVTYSIRFDDKDLQLLSPGQKGIVLLLVYLEVDQEDNRPLIIDQPEDNLDSLSVYASLIDYFRKRKKTRQIIIITHNPNLVLNTDAEQIVIADFDGSRVPRIQYRSGAIEDVAASDDVPSIREGICRILEGGREAFLRREQKYAIEPF